MTVWQSSMVCFFVEFINEGPQKLNWKGLIHSSFYSSCFRNKIKNKRKKRKISGKRALRNLDYDELRK